MMAQGQKDHPAASVILAAGGILERMTPNGPEVAIIRRVRYGEEWALPKGKVQSGEDYAEAAIREVEEETGYSVSVERFAGVSRHPVEGVPKVVFYWVMHPVGGAFEPTEEVKELVWLTPERARDRLTHDDQVELLNEVFGMETSRNPNLWQRSRAAILRLVSFQRYRRLVSTIDAHQKELECLRSNADDECFDIASRTLEAAKESAYQGFIDQGWKQLQAALRLQILVLDPDENKDRLHAHVLRLRQETTKLKKWRECAANQLLETDDEGDILPSVQNIYQAMHLRDGHYANQAYKNSLLRWHVLTLGLALVVLVCTLLYGLNGENSLLHVPLRANGADNTGPQLFIGVALFGLIGGTLSAVFKAPASTEDSRIPEVTSTVRLTLLRLVAGAGAAIVVVMAVQSGLINLLDPQPGAGSDGSVSLYGFYVIAFAAGFSERLVLRAAEGWANK